MSEAIDTSNKFMVGGCAGDKVIITGLPGRPAMSCSEAAVLAAWLVAISMKEEVFKEALQEIYGL